MEFLVTEGPMPIPPRTINETWLNISLIDVMLGGDRSVTSSHTPLIIDTLTRFSVGAADDSAIVLVITSPKHSTRMPPAPQERFLGVTPAKELLDLSGLSSATLAEVFGVSRTMYYKWKEGATPRDERFQHLVNVLAHVKAARQQLATVVDFTSWLRTPISPGAKTPLDYLRVSNFNVFRGLVLRASAAQFTSAPLRSVIPEQKMSAAERVALRERISPSPRIEDDED